MKYKEIKKKKRNNSYQQKIKTTYKLFYDKSLLKLLKPTYSYIDKYR